jgi:hypothetical protein
MGSFYIGTPFLGQKVTELETALTAANAAIAANAGDTATLQTWASDRVKYAYPNGGSEGDERTLAVGSYYHLQSPFPSGVKFSAMAEYFSTSKDEWIELGTMIFNRDSGGYGVNCFSRSSEGLCTVVTGNGGLVNLAVHGSSWENLNIGSLTTSKWRVRCARED